jgi:creatinine amidohydrolase
MKLKPLYTVPGPKSLYEMTREEVQEALAKTDTILLPAGAVEQHGPHLPLGSDTIQGIDMCKRTQLLLEKEGVPVLVGPPFIYGLSSAHMDFPGSITLTPKTMLSVMEETCLSLYHHGFRKFALIMAHGGNWPIMQVAAQSIVAQTEEAEVIALNWLDLIHDKYSKILTSKKYEGHSGEGETARMLSSTPELVDMKRAHTFYPDKPAPTETDYPGGFFKPKRSMKAVTLYGSVGDPTLATAEEGDKIYDAIAEWLAANIKREFTPKPARR